MKRFFLSLRSSMLLLVTTFLFVSTVFAQDTLSERTSFPAKPAYQNEAKSLADRADSMKKAQMLAARSRLLQGLETLRKLPFAAAFLLENDNRYQTPALIAALPGQAVTSLRAFQSVFSIRASLNVGGIPINMAYSTNRDISAGPAAFIPTLFKFDFNAKTMTGFFRNDLERYYAIQRNLLSGSGAGTYIRHHIEQELRQKINPSDFKAAGLEAYLQRPEALQALLSSSDVILRERLVAVLHDSLSVHESRLLKDTALIPALAAADRQALLQQPRSASAVVQVLRQNLKDSIGEEALTDTLIQLFLAAGDSKAASMAKRIAFALRAEGTGGLLKLTDTVVTNKSIAAQADVAVNVIAGLREDFERRGYNLEQIVQMDRLLDPSTGFISRAEITQRYLDKKPVNRLQQIFSRVNSFKIGAFSNRLPVSVTNGELLVKGTDITLNTGNLPLTFGFGSLNDFNGIKDAGYRNSTYNQARSIVYIGTRVRQGNIDKVRIAIASSLQRQASSVDNYPMPVLSQNTVAFTAARDFSFKRAGEFTVDISRSGTLYANRYEAGSNMVFDRQGGLTADPMADLFTAMSVGLTHRATFQRQGMTEQFYINYSGQGYQNPGANGYGGGRFRFGGQLRKALFSDKLMFMVRTDIKEQPISYTSDDKWQSQLIQIDSRYKVNRRLTFNFRYTSTGTDKKIDGSPLHVYSLHKFQFDGITRYRFGKVQTVHSFSTSVQDYSQANTVGSAGDMLMLNSVQTAIWGKQTLTLNLFYNKELSREQLIGNMFNADAALNYLAFGQIRFTTGLNYLANGSIARQAGVKQGVQVFSTHAFEMDSYIDLRRNLLTPKYADLYATCRAEIVLRYHFNLQ